MTQQKRILFLSSFLPDTEYCLNNSIGQISAANDSLQKAILLGFEQNDTKVDFVNVPNIGAYPNRFRKIVTPSYKHIFSDNIKGHNIGILNLPLIKHFFIYLSLIRNLNKLNLNNYDGVFVFDFYPPFLKLILKIRKRSKIKIILYAPDLPQYTGSNDNLLSRYLLKKSQDLIDNSIPVLDGFIFVAEPMIKKLGITNKNIAVVEGIWNSGNDDIREVKNNIQEDYFFYSGSLGERHGIKDLIDAFLIAHITKLKLVICGDGDSVNFVKAKAEKHENIIFLGQISKKEVISLQKHAKLLVNPRKSEGEFTKYSFPSKILEYYASATPTFMYRLEGIPQEYYDYCITSEDETAIGLANIFDLFFEERTLKFSEKAKQARDFIINNKNPQAQTAKILKLFN